MQTKPVILERGGDKDKLFNLYAPSALFQIPSELRAKEYIRWLTGIIQEFIRSLSPHYSNEYGAERFYFSDVGEEGGIGGIYIGKEYFDHCKCFVFDGEDPRNVSDWKGVRLINHMDQRSKVEPLYLLAEKFELFLRNHSIFYTRFGNFAGGQMELVEMVTK